MSNYQRKRGKYVLPGTVYMKTIYQIRDYYRLKEKNQDTIDAGPDPGEVRVSGSRSGSTTERKAMQIYADSVIVDAIDKALSEIPKEYRKGVWQSVMYSEPYPLDGARSTYGLHKSRFVYKIATYLDFI